MSTKSFKLTALALAMAFYVGNAVAEEMKPSEAGTEQTRAQTDLGLAQQQLALESKAEEERLAAEKKAEEARLAAEKQVLAEQGLAERIGETKLQFKPLIAKIYAENNFMPLWQDEKAKQQFLRDYALMVASGISKRSANALNAVSQSAGKEAFVQDVILTDAFLDYLFYANNVKKSAQKWLYSENSYKAGKPDENQVDSWVSAVKNNDVFAFVNNLSSENPLFKQTLAKVENLILNGKLDKNGINELHRFAINAQRLRILPEFDNGIFVNVPSYQLNYYRDGKLVLNSRVIVGTNKRKTPVMFSRLSNVVVNPPWNAPTRLINEDIIPKVRRDPSYIYRNGYTIIDGKGNTIDPYTIDWENMTAKKFPYRLRQVPSDNSALGNYKFNMPSSEAIYLHDTPKRSLFGNKRRDLSSGCVRVEKSEELATVLLKEAGWTAERKQSVLKSRKTTSVTVKSNNPVFLYYVTAWVDKGQVHTLPDVYGYDKAPNLSYIDWDILKKYLQP
ncbi:L,D-transpeptidase family protein [Aggregatibacter actinomycetemcomitans]|uniref:L,D-transpeptidase family protein n=1 Tax=Aggregatibacter actinomycetemcomitans TaxID=714 RepID=UPI00197BDA5E|nr:L,D-transpeptidase family protein [Aggregatibacter actinomycetemcomitans]MBN6069648.1 L,D-transpeptidase family protein [Aggregatibacter actinomycetemcomitans]